MRPFLVYTVSRVGLLAVTLGVLYLIGIHDIFWLIVISFVISGIASYVLLSKQRDAVSKQISRDRGA